MSGQVTEAELLTELMESYMDALLIHLQVCDFFGEDKPPTNGNSCIQYPNLEVAKKTEAFLKTYGSTTTNKKAVKINDYFLPYLKLLMANPNVSIEEIGFVGGVLAKRAVQLSQDIQPASSTNLVDDYNMLHLGGGFAS